MKKTPLFITGLSLSSGTAIGVATKHLMASFPEVRHLYWLRNDMNADPAFSCRVDHPLVSRLALFQRPTVFRRLAFVTRLSWWNGTVLWPSKQRWLKKEYEGKVSGIYTSPINRAEAARARHLVELLDRPFVLHLWDSLDGHIEEDPNLIWLVQNAREVMAVSKLMVDDLKAMGIDADTLLFMRKPSLWQAENAPVDKKIKIGLLGELHRYFDGVKLLEEAIPMLESRGYEVEWIYIGRQRNADRVNARLERKLTTTGFLSDEERDATLAHCHFGFLPGPSQSPDVDMVSRYSMPSRMLDFLAVGLPLIGTVHPDSSTASFFRSLELTEPFVYENPEALADRIQALCTPDAWRASACQSVKAFDQFLRESPSEKLLAAMKSLGD